MRRVLPPRSSLGFSLLELLVVVTIIGIFAGAAVLSVGIVGNDREIEREARRLQSLVSLLREEALMQSRDFGVQFFEDGYQFVTYDYQQLTWVPPQADRLLAKRSLKQPLRLRLRVEDRDLVLDPADAPRRRGSVEAAPQPQIMVLSSGEITPFEAAVYRELTGGRYVLVAGIDGSVEVQQDGFEE